MAQERPDERFLGKYKLESSDSNFDAFLKEIGIGLVKRKLANTSYPTLELTKDDQDYITMVAKAPFRTQTARFRLGEEFDEERMDGKVVKSVVTFAGNTFTQMQKDPDYPNLDIKYVREFTGDKINVTSTANGVSCLRVYKRLEA